MPAHSKAIHATHVHKSYQLRCDQYESLLDRAGGACEICRRPWQPNTSCMPQIDHDHRWGEPAVRGLVCVACNAHMRRVDSGERSYDAATARYVDRAWFLHEGRLTYERFFREVAKPDHDQHAYDIYVAERRRAHERQHGHGTPMKFDWLLLHWSSHLEQITRQRCVLVEVQYRSGRRRYKTKLK